MANQKQKQKQLIQQLPSVELEKEEKVLEASKILKELILGITDESISDIEKEGLLNELYSIITPLKNEYLSGKNPYLIRIFSTIPSQVGEFYYNISKYSPSSIREILYLYQKTNNDIKSEIPNFELMIDRIREKEKDQPEISIKTKAYNLFTNIINTNIENMNADNDYIALKQAGL